MNEEWHSVTPTFVRVKSIDFLRDLLQLFGLARRRNGAAMSYVCENLQECSLDKDEMLSLLGEVLKAPILVTILRGNGIEFQGKGVKRYIRIADNYCARIAWKVDIYLIQLHGSSQATTLRECDFSEHSEHHESEDRSKEYKESIDAGTAGHVAVTSLAGGQSRRHRGGDAGPVQEDQGGAACADAV